MFAIFNPVLLPIFLTTSSRLVFAQTVEAPNDHQGWCYYCSDDNAPPLCNAQCTVAIEKLCKGDLTQNATVVEQDCLVHYMPPVYPIDRQGSRPHGDSAQSCVFFFDQILNSCGKDAGSPIPSPPAINTSYCTTSGGGGTYGWNDDGTVMEYSNSSYYNGRYIITTNGTDQCGQAEASWQQATSVIMWNDSWIGPNDQVVLDTNPPPLPATVASMAAAMPTPNPVCDLEVCDIYDHPYYAISPVAPWPEGGDNMLRHRIVYEGWSEDEGSNRLFNSLADRCGPNPGNFQAYMNGSQRIADFDLPGPEHDLCHCIPDAIFDASVGITLPWDAFCSGGWSQEKSFARLDPEGGLRRRGEQGWIGKKDLQRDPHRIVYKGSDG